MRLPRYPKYRSSTIPWAIEIPEHWELRKTKFLFDLMQRPCREDDGIVTAFRDGEVTLRSNRRIDGFTNALQEIGYQGIRHGDLVIHAMDAFAGAIGVSDSEGKSTPVYSVCRPKPDVSNSWYYGRLLRHMALSGFINALAKGIRERSTEFRWAEAGNVLLPVPSIKEQSSIVEFLDRETAKIDALVEEQRRLIELLKEKRQAVISHAVTKGLNPDAPMKDSGIEWLGEIPEHWKVGPIKRWFRTTSGGTPPTDRPEEFYTDEGGFPWIRTTDLNNGVLETFEVSITEKAISATACSMLPKGCVLVAMYGGEGTIGKNSLLAIPACINQAVCALVPNAEFSERFTHRYIEFFRPYWMIGAESSRKDPNISQDLIRNAAILCPPGGEQLAIADYLDHETVRFDRLMTEATRAIDLLQERRTALISAAVTGKIDVRGMAKEQTA